MEKCFYCERHFVESYNLKGLLDSTLDHILPQALGGSNKAENIVLCCLQCNALKGRMTLFQFEEYVRDLKSEEELLVAGYTKRDIKNIAKNAWRLRNAVAENKISIYNPHKIVYDRVETFVEKRRYHQEFIDDLPRMIGFATALIRKFELRSVNGLDPWDLINSSYVEWISTRKAYSADAFRMCMYVFIREEREHLRRYLDMGAQAYVKKGAESCVCRKCNEILNINAFKKKVEGVYKMICIKCYNLENRKNNLAYYKARKYDPALRKMRAKACKKYISNPEVKEKHKEKMRQYALYQKENLTDIYIRGLLRGRGISTSNITDQMIEFERGKIKTQLKAA